MKASQNRDDAKINELNDKLKQYEETIQDLKDDRDSTLEKLSKQEERISNLENASPQGGNPLAELLRELEYEMKLLTDRIKDTQMKINDLSAENKKVSEGLNEEDTDTPELKEVEDKRKDLEGEVNSLKGRAGQFEDKLKLLNMKMIDEQAKPDGEKLQESEEERVTKMDENILKLRKKLTDMEELLKNMRRRRKIKISDGANDLDTIIDELREDLESEIRLLKDRVQKNEDNTDKVDFKSNNNSSKIDSLENLFKDQDFRLNNLSKEFSAHKLDFDDLSKKVKELKDLVNTKTDNDIFEREISCKLES